MIFRISEALGHQCFFLFGFLGWQNVHQCFVSFQFYQLFLQPFPLLFFAVQLLFLLSFLLFVFFCLFCQSLLFSLLLGIGFFSFLTLFFLQKSSRFYPLVFPYPILEYLTRKSTSLFSSRWVSYGLGPDLVPCNTLPAILSFRVVRGTPNSNAARFTPFLPLFTASIATCIESSDQSVAFLGGWQWGE